MDGSHGTFNCKDHVTIKIANGCRHTRGIPTAKGHTKGIVVDSSPKLTRDDWIKEQSEDSDINLIVQLLKDDKLKKYVATETDSCGIQVLLKYHKDLFLRNGLLYQRVSLKNHQGPISQFVLPKSFICKVILACHDDSGHLGMGRTLGLLQEGSFGLKWQMLCTYTYAHVIDAQDLSSPRKDLRCGQYLFHTIWS